MLSHNNFNLTSSWAQGFCRKTSKGFTLIELLIVVAIIGILSSIGYAAYTEHVREGYRTEAQSALLQLQQAMERFYTENNTYVGTHDGGTPEADVFPATAPLNSSNPKYNLTITADATSYTLQATPIDGTIVDNDGIYSLEHTGQKAYKGENGWDR